MKSMVADNLKRIIEARCLKQAAVAAKSGFTSQQFCDMLAGRKVIRADYMPRIAQAMGVTVSDIYNAVSDEMVS